MSAATRLKPLAGVLTTTTALISLAALPPVRDFLARHLAPTTSTNIWRTLALILALLNLKNLPFIWHFRVLRAIVYQLYFQPHPQKPRHLFAPMITSSRNTPYDTDYNLHKSNSTYFADLDVSRAHYMGAIIRTGLLRLNKGDEEGLRQETVQTPGKYAIALGGVSCFFQRQIEPFQAFEVWTRMLAWDRKWVYTVSHIVKKGAIKPDSYVLQPWKKGRSSAERDKAQADGKELTKHIFATSVARYVFKKGRLTINPELVLERSELLPTRPEGMGLPPRAEASNDSTPVAVETPTASAVNGGLTSPESAATEISQKLDRVAGGDVRAEVRVDDEDWSWDDMERERLRGLKIASHFDSLGAAHGELRAGEVLGEFGDYW